MKPLSTRVLAFVFGMFISITIMVPFLPIWGVKPYTNVTILEESWTVQGLTIRASFVKNGQCKLIDFSVISFADGIPSYVGYEDLDGLVDNYDRSAGKQSLNIIVPTNPSKMDFLELRTRHQCILDKEGHTEVITKVFSRHETNQKNME